MIADRIKGLRESHGMTQATLAKKLGITRSGVNAWEMGLTVPSTQSIVDLARLFYVSTDYLLGVNSTATIPVDGLSEEDILLMKQMVQHLKNIRSEIKEDV